MRSYVKLSALLLVLALGFAELAVAQTRPGPPPGPRGGRQGERAVPPQRAGNLVQEQWNALVLRRSRQFLALSEQQEPNFLAKMMRLQDVRDRHQRERLRLVAELGRLTAPESATPANDATLVTKLRELGEFDAQAAEQEQAALAAVDEVLTPFQRARFRFFEERMDVQKQEMLAQVIRNAPANARGTGREGEPAAAVKPIGRGGGK